LKPLDQCRLYTFIDEAYRRQRDYRDLAKALCDGGADVIQLRMKGKGHEVITQAAELIAPVTETYQVHLVINDCLEVHQACLTPSRIWARRIFSMLDTKALNNSSNPIEVSI
jgi:thiamine monophosphate synthase